MSAEVARVALQGASYAVERVDGGADALAERVCAAIPSGRLVVVTDAVVDALYGDLVVDALAQAGRAVRRLKVPAGEAAKSIDVAAGLWDALLEDGIERGDALVALGGGVTGDVAGFVASTVVRGIRVVQVPTTVLSMADAAIGGKTGINTRQGKNLVGTFHQPAAVLLWVHALPTLPERERRSGLAEVVKSALIAGEPELAALESDAGALAAGDVQALGRAVAMAAALKASVVSRDPLERGARLLLNLGHTFGHAIEHAAGYGAWTHGEAVSAGMMCALRFGPTAGVGGEGLARRVGRLLSELKLPVDPPSLTVDQWVVPMTRDKKRSADSVRLILCADVGACAVVPTRYEALVAWLDDVC